MVPQLTAQADIGLAPLPTSIDLSIDVDRRAIDLLVADGRPSLHQIT